MKPPPAFFYGKSRVVVCRDEFDLGEQAAGAVGRTMRELLASSAEIRAIFAAGESQITFLDALARQPGIEWARVVCFGMDELHDVRMSEQYTCGYQIAKQLWEKVGPKEVHRIQFDAPDPAAEARRFERLLREAGPIDILCQGIGTSGHLALNEPFDTDFHDPSWVKVVRVAEQSKRQLRDDPNFSGLGYIPEKGITMTIPALLSSRRIFTIVPLALKRRILTALFALVEPAPALPASILLQVDSVLFVDRNSCPESRPMIAPSGI